VQVQTESTAVPPPCAYSVHHRRSLFQPVGAAHDRLHPAGCHQVGQHLQVLLVGRRDQRAQALTHEGREQNGPDGAAEAHGPPAARPADDHEGARRGQRSAQGRQRPIAADVDDDVVEPATVGDLLAGVIDHMVGTERADQLPVPGAAHSGHLGPECLGDLHGQSSDTTGRDSVLGTLRRAGFGPQMAMRGFSILDSFIYGFILQEQSLAFDDQEQLDEVGADLLQQMADQYPYLTEATRHAMEAGYDFTTEFLFGLELIIEALKRILEVDTPEPTANAAQSD
jgi:hypothetical protein